MKEDETVNEYFARTLRIAKSMKMCGECMRGNIIVAKILWFMTLKFNYVVCSIEESNNLDTMTIDELQSSLLVHEQRMLCHVEEEQTLQITYEDRGGRGRGRGRQPINKAEIECFKCHKYGHFQYECPTWEKKINYAEVEDKVDPEDELLLMASLDFKQGKTEEWFLDSGCSNHMSGNKNWFSELYENFRHAVKLGNDTQIIVMGKGSVQLNVDGVTHVISHVYYVSELTNNLLSIGQLQENDLSILIQNGKCKVSHPERGQIMNTDMKGNRMFALTATHAPLNSKCFQMELEEGSQLWHNRFGHLSYNGLKTLSSKQLVNGLPTVTVLREICTHCLAGKQHRNPMPKKSLWRA